MKMLDIDKKVIFYIRKYLTIQSMISRKYLPIQSMISTSTEKSEYSWKSHFSVHCTKSEVFH